MAELKGLKKPVKLKAADGGNQPGWSSSGTELFYWQGADLIGVTFTTDPTFQVVEEQRLLTFPDRYPGSGGQGFAVGPDGRFLLIRSITEPGVAPTEINLLQNWFEELRERLGN